MLKSKKRNLKSKSVKAKRLKKNCSITSDGEATRPVELRVDESDAELEKDVEEGEQSNIFNGDLHTAADQFHSHFAYELNDEDIAQLKNKYTNDEMFSWEILHRILFMKRSSMPSLLPKAMKPTLNQPISGGGVEMPGINKRLSENWNNEKREMGFSTLQNEVFTILSQYISLYYPCCDNVDDEEAIRETYCLHALNHIVKSRATIVKNDKRLSKLDPTQLENANCRDQGFTRPKVLILLPFRDRCLKVVNFFIKLLKSEKKMEVSNLKRFQTEFNVEENEEGESLQSTDLLKKPSDYQRIFSGNTNEHFLLGISLMNKGLRLFSPFYSSDIIVASPLGLRTVIGEKGEAHYEHDFLSSIEVCMLDNSDVFLMQNWEHVLHIIKHLHLQPKDPHGVDFQRVRNSVLEGHAKHYCQTIVLSSVSIPQISSILTKYCFNYKGLVMVQNVVEKGSICSVTRSLPQLYHKLATETFSDVQNIRFNFFVQQILKQIKEKKMNQVLIYFPQYFDYVRLRNYLRRENFSGEETSFACVCEYMNNHAVKKSKKKFTSGQCRILLYTERFHFYNRPKLRGIHNLIFYELPTFPQFYTELCNMIDLLEENQITSNSIIALYSKYDSSKLVAVLGNKRAEELLRSQKRVHMFMTENNS